MDYIDPLWRTAILIVVTIIAIRLSGLRSLSKMTAFDFVLTVAVGSILAAGIVNPDKPIGIAIASVIAVFGLQFLISLMRRWVPGVENAIGNTPVLLMKDQQILHDNLKAARVSEDDLIAKLREANVLDFCEVRAVVLEATGDISVLHGAKDGMDLSPSLLKGVQ